MAINIDKVNVNNIEMLDRVINEYVNVINNNLIRKNSLSNPHNVISNSGIEKELLGLISKEIESINSFTNNILLSFDNALLDYKKYVEEKK